MCYFPGRTMRSALARAALSPRWLALWLVLGVAAGAVAQEGPSQKAKIEQMRTLLKSIQWQRGPTVGKIGTVAEVKVPAGYQFTEQQGAAAWAELNQNQPDPNQLGVLTPVGFHGWFLTFSYHDVGHIPNDEKGQLDAGAILATIRQGTEQGNAYRLSKGWPALTIVGWTRPPAYDEATHHLVWAVAARSNQKDSVNYNTRILGRTGVVSANLVVGTEGLERGLAADEEPPGRFPVHRRQPIRGMAIGRQARAVWPDGLDHRRGRDRRREERAAGQSRRLDRQIRQGHLYRRRGPGGGNLEIPHKPPPPPPGARVMPFHLSDTEWVLLIVAGIYLAECACWLRRGAVCFSSFFGRNFPLRSPSFLGNADHTLVFAPPLPWTHSFICEPWPLAIGAEGIALPADGAKPAADGGGETDRHIPFHAVRSIEHDKCEVRINGRPIARAASADHARLLATMLRELARAEQGDRRQAIEDRMRNSMDIDAIAARVSEFKKQSRCLKTSATVLFFYTFAIGPLLYYASPIQSWSLVWAYLTGYLVLWLFTIGDYFAFRRRFVEEPFAQGLRQAAMLLLSPASAMRSLETLGRGALAAYHPLAVAAAICSKKTCRTVGKPILLHLRHPPPAAAAEEAAWARADQWFRATGRMFGTGPSPRGDRFGGIAAAAGPACGRPLVLPEMPQSVCSARGRLCGLRRRSPGTFCRPTRCGRRGLADLGQAGRSPAGTVGR